MTIFAFHKVDVVLAGERLERRVHGFTLCPFAMEINTAPAHDMTATILFALQSEKGLAIGRGNDNLILPIAGGYRIRRGGPKIAGQGGILL